MSTHPKVLMHCQVLHATRGFLLLSLLSILNASVAFSDTRGKLTGRVVDQKNIPVLGANVLLIGTTIGAAANEEGYYNILNVPAGAYEVRFSGIGYTTRTVKDVRVNAGQTTTLNVVLPEEAVQAQEVVVTAVRPLVDTRQTSAVAILGKDDIDVMPVQNLNDIVKLQAGVVDGHFRGGRSGEVQYQVDGVSVNNPYDNTSTVQLDKSVLQEVQVISGTFDAEYGQAMSGVVNAVLRSGSEDRFDVYAESYIGDYLPNSSNRNTYPYFTTVDPVRIQSHTFTLSGPSGLPQTAFLISLRKYGDDGYLFGQRRFLPTDSSDFQARQFNGTGDRASVPMSTNSELSWQFKISNKSIDDIQLSYQSIGSTGDSKNYDFGYRFNPDGRTTQKKFSMVHGIDITHTLSSTMFYTLSVRQNFFRYTDWAFSSIDDPGYQRAGQPIGDGNYELGAIVQGVNLNRFEQESNGGVLKGSLTSQVERFHLFKAGFEAQTSSMKFGAPGTVYHETRNGRDLIIPVVDDSLHPKAKTYYPMSFAAYVQDRVEMTDLLVRIGIRLEYFDAQSTIPGDLANPANVISGAPQSTPRKTTKKLAIAPRLGISYPMSEKGAVYFSYGHFYQMPGMGLMYSNNDYSILKNLQAGAVDYGVMGNPDLKPEFTTQYEFGIKSEFSGNSGIDVSIFYKDIRDLLGVEFIQTYTAAQYSRMTNIDFGSVYGATIFYDQRLTDQLSWSLSYTYQKALGNSSDPFETANIAAAGGDPRPRQIPFAWDQTHTINSTLSLNIPGDFSATAILRYGNGSPYTPAIGSGFGAQLERNSSRKPTWTLVDVRAEKYFSLDGAQLSMFFRASNLFDDQYANGFVFETTGSPYYSLTPGGDAAQLQNPSRFNQPRRVELGLSVKL
ncbi:MAG: TonB-dependent receptor [Bacteroidota bacterium]